MSSTFPASAERLKTASEPVRLCDGNYEIVRFVYDAAGSHSPTIDIVLKHRGAHAKTHYRFSGVKLECLPPMAAPATIVVMNPRIRGWEAPRELQISVGEDHPDAGVLFWAGDVEQVVERDKA
jgi:hypothetical protein